MLNWPVDNAITLYGLLGGLAAVLLVTFWFTRKPRWLIGLGVVAALTGVVLLLSLLIVTDRQQIVRSIQTMTANVQARRPDLVFAEISEEFQRKRWNKRDFRKMVEARILKGEVRECQVRGFEFEEVSRSRRTATVLFLVRGVAHGLEVPDYRCRATYGLDPDGQWRLKGFQLFDQFTDPHSGAEVPLPF